MNDETEKPEDAGAEPTGPLGGERLAAARREQQISVLEIAKELHLDEPKVRALEQNDFETLGAPVFAKGHMRKYAQLVGVNPDDVLADYYRLTRSQTIPPVITTRSKPRREMSPGPWIAIIVAILVAALAYWLLVHRPFDPAFRGGRPEPVSPAVVETAPVEAPAGEETADEEAADEETADEEAADEERPETGPQPTQEQPAAEPVADAAVPAQAQPVQAGEVRLSVMFHGDCWTEISDASGRRLYFGLGQAGQTIDVSGASPLSVLFGDSDNVSLRVNGDDFAIADADRRGRTARLMLYGS